MHTRRANHGVLQELGKSVRVAYINQRRSWVCLKGQSPNYMPSTSWGKGSPSTWVKIAKFLIDHQIRDYPRFFLRIFEQRGRQKLPPTPKQLYGPGALLIWEEMSTPQAMLAARATVLLEWNIQKRTFVSEVATRKRQLPGLTDREALQSVIVSRAVELSPLYRYCVALGEGLPRPASLYAEMALRQYVGARTLYDEVWGGWIPEHLKVEAATVCRQLPEVDDEEE